DGGAPSASLTALKPFSISSIILASFDGSGWSFLATRFGQALWLARLACDQVWPPMLWPAAATSLRISGCHSACLPIGKNVAFTQCCARASSTARVLPGQGPSSKVSTTSFSTRKSYCLYCSKPNPGPPVVSISTVRARPSALGLFAQAPVPWAAAGTTDAASATHDNVIALAQSIATPVRNRNESRFAQRCGAACTLRKHGLRNDTLFFGAVSPWAHPLVDPSAGRLHFLRRLTQFHHAAMLRSLLHRAVTTSTGGTHVHA